MSLDLFINSAIAANKELYKLINSDAKSSFYEHFSKGAGGDVSSGIDLAAEEIFIKHLLSYGSIHSEESGVVGDGKKRIILDPLDGSDNFLSKLPYFGTSVALEIDGEIRSAVICNLANEDLFVKGRDFFKYTKLGKLDFKDVSKHKHSTVGVFEKAYKSEILAPKMKKANIKYRNPGALALSLAYAHYLDFVMFEGEIREYDVAAGFYMCEGLEFYKEDKFFLISKDKNLFDKLIKIIKETN